MITSINQKVMPNTLVMILGPDEKGEQVEQKQDVVRISSAKKDEPLGYNFFNIERLLDVTKFHDGQVALDETAVEKLNQHLTEVGFNADLVFDSTPKIIYGKVLTSEAHPDSDHLHITTVDIGREKPVQIVCGAPNVAAGQTVVVAIPGAMMPNGQLIWPGKLRGVDSYGMITSARELGLPHAPDKRGILVVGDENKPGKGYEPEKLGRLLEKGSL